MSDKASSVRIDWFDGTVTDSPNSYSSRPTRNEHESSSTPQENERKLMGYRRLFDLSQLEALDIAFQLTERSSFWDLLETNLKLDFIVLIVKILAKLFRSFESNPKSITLKKIFATKLLPSKFFSTLEGYMTNLPLTRISDKKTNMQFWDDIESFYKSVIEVCQGLCKLEKVDQAKRLLEMASISVNKVMDEHEEQFSTELFERFHNTMEFVNELYDQENKQKINTVAKTITEEQRMYKKLSIFPTADDLIGNSEVKIEANIVNGAYTSVEHYLDVQFKLLREDCFGPLRYAIGKYLENPDAQKHENIKVYTKVRVLSAHVVPNYGHGFYVGQLVRIAKTDDIEHPKHRMYGALLLFTSDNFKTVLCATVLDCCPLEYVFDSSFRHVAVQFHTPIASSVYSEVFTMVESELFFEPYHKVLKVLQDSDDVPMAKYIVHVQNETQPPAYIDANTNYTIHNGKQEFTFPVLNLCQWPSNECLGLDESQMKAFQRALTEEFVVIQGPPGTGKTFIGIKIATTLLQNLSLLGSPILIISYTNNALDQFLEALLKVTDRIVRIGSQSKSDLLEPYTLSKWTAKSRNKHRQAYKAKQKEQYKMMTKISIALSDVKKCDEELLAYKTVKPYLVNDGCVIELHSVKGDPMIPWLFNETSDGVEATKVLDDTKTIDSETIDTCFSDEFAQNEIDSMNRSIKSVKDVANENLDGKKMVEGFQMAIENMRNRLDIFNKYMNNKDVIQEVRKVTNPYDLTIDERWATYFRATMCIKEKLNKKIAELQELCSVVSSEVLEAKQLTEAAAANRARVIGATTAAAAARTAMLHQLRPSIVIVEEAAEVFETHVVASLTRHCQHLILIGDHKQLRPLAAHYKLAKDYNIEVSLFERMLRNGYHASTMTIQRRMRPEFVDLLVPTIYPKLDCHPSVFDYPEVKGFENASLAFLSHSAPETYCGHSYINEFEAKHCLFLARDLRRQGYKKSDITILSTYSGQVTEMQKNCEEEKFKELNDMKITVVDDYQGQENKIIILSLVRSNKEGKIGFLGEPNRICVALSRAKEGLYIFGNIDLLKSASDLWSKIHDKLVKQDAIVDYSKYYKVSYDEISTKPLHPSISPLSSTAGHRPPP